MKVRSTILAVLATTTALGGAYVIQERREGYRDTPVLPGQKWRVHDVDRPYPRAVTPGATVGAAPSDAIVLFDGTDLSQWMQGDTNDPARARPARWKSVDGTLQVTPGTGDLYSRQKFGDMQLHIEWQESPNVTGEGQGRGNSGVFLMGEFEIQVLDSYKHATYADGQAGGLYGQWPPLVNPMRPPGEWQTYDVIFEAPKWDGGKLTSPAYVTLFFNGVMVHHHQKLNGPSAHAQILPYTVGKSEGRLRLQDHGPREPLRFRNIWVRKLRGYDEP